MGSGDARGTNVNLPLPPGCGDEDYLNVFNEVLVPVAERFNPQLILVSAGYDAHWADSIASMQVTVTGFARMVGILKQLAESLCRGRILFTLEGGYHYEALAASVRATLDVLLGNPNIIDPLGEPKSGRNSTGASDIIQTVKSTHGLM